MRLTLNVWRQKNANDPGKFVTYEHPEVNEHMSFLEMLDVLNQRLIERGEDPIAFDHDCREGICGACSMMISGVAHGPERATTVGVQRDERPSLSHWVRTQRVPSSPR